MDKKYAKCTRSASYKDKDDVSHLRITEFNRSSEFSVREQDKLVWSSKDDIGSVLTIWEKKDQIIATMRAMRVIGKAEAEECLSCSVHETVNYPVVVFNNAATRIEYRNRGLNQVLRYHFIEAALRSDVQTLISPVYEGAPRVKFMESIGYTFKVPERNWQTKLNVHSRRILAMLKNEDFQEALNLLKARRLEIIQEYPWYGEKITF